MNDGGEGRKRSSDVFDTTSPEGESHAKRSRTCAVNDPPSTQNDTIPSNSINEGEYIKNMCVLLFLADFSKK